MGSQRVGHDCVTFTFTLYIYTIVYLVYIPAAAAKSLQLCPTLRDPMDGSPVPGILQARTLEWVAISFSTHKTI